MSEQAERYLGVRRILLGILAGTGDPGDVGAPPGPSPDEELAPALDFERCALPLRNRLAAASRDPHEPLAGVAREIATRELQRVTSARAVLREIGDVARGRGWKVVVLKGGAAVDSDEPVDVADVDILVASEVASALATALEAEGFRSGGLDSPWAHHLYPRVREGDVKLEIHRHINGLDDPAALIDRAVRLERAPGLLRLAPRDHLFHLLYHSVVHHPERRGCLRDLLLVSRALDECTGDDVSEVRSRIDRSQHPWALRDALAMGEELHAGRPVRDRFAGARVRALLLRPFPVVSRLPKVGPAHRFASLLTVTERPWTTELADWLSRRSEVRPGERLERWAPPVGRILLRVILAAAALVAILMALDVEWRFRRIRDSLALPDADD